MTNRKTKPLTLSSKRFMGLILDDSIFARTFTTMEIVNLRVLEDVMIQFALTNKTTVFIVTKEDALYSKHEEIFVFDLGDICFTENSVYKIRLKPIEEVLKHLEDINALSETIDDIKEIYYRFEHNHRYVFNKE